MEIKILKGNQEIADYLGMSVQTFWRKRDELDIPYYKVGTRVFARSVALDEWAAEREAVFRCGSNAPGAELGSEPESMTD